MIMLSLMTFPLHPSGSPVGFVPLSHWTFEVPMSAIWWNTPGGICAEIQAQIWRWWIDMFVYVRNSIFLEPRQSSWYNGGQYVDYDNCGRHVTTTCVMHWLIQHNPNGSSLKRSEGEWSHWGSERRDSAQHECLVIRIRAGWHGHYITISRQHQEARMSVDGGVWHSIAAVGGRRRSRCMCDRLSAQGFAPHSWWRLCLQSVLYSVGAGQNNCVGHTLRRMQ